MKPIRILFVMALLTVFVCCANTPSNKAGEVTGESASTSAEAKSNVETPLDVKSFGLLGNVKEVLLSTREYEVGAEQDAWEKTDVLDLAFDEKGRVVRDEFENLYAYDAKGNFTKGLSDKTVMKRDEKGRVIYYENRQDEEDDEGFTMKFEYDAQGRMSKVEIVGWEHTIDHTFTYTDDHVYPDRANIESEDEGDHYSTVIDYDYKSFDDKGNWTEREAHSYAKHTVDDELEGETKLVITEKRKIQYYQ